MIRLPVWFPGTPVFARLPPVFRPGEMHPYPAVGEIGTSQALPRETPGASRFGMDAGPELLWYSKAVAEGVSRGRCERQSCLERCTSKGVFLAAEARYERSAAKKFAGRCEDGT